MMAGLFHVRWVVRRDMPDVLAIEESSFEFPWSEEDFWKSLRQRNMVGMVAELGTVVTGYMVYALMPKGLDLLNLAVHPELHGAGHGRVLIEKLLSKLGTRRRWIECQVRERNLPAQQFFRHMGFRATGVLWDHYEDTDEDAYQFRFEQVFFERD